MGIDDRIKKVRENEALTQREFADRIGYSQSFIGRLETGKIPNPSPAFISSVAETFHVSREWLETGEGEVDFAVKNGGEHIGDRVENMRKHLNLSQQELAAKVGCSRTQISLIESGKSGTSSQMLEKLSSALEVRPDWLRTGRGESGREDYLMVYELLNKDSRTRLQVYEWLLRKEMKGRMNDNKKNDSDGNN